MTNRLALMHNLLADALPERRCPYLQRDAEGCRCQRVVAALVGELPPEEARQAGRLVCDHISLQLWCLAGPERWPACVHFG